MFQIRNKIQFLRVLRYLSVGGSAALLDYGLFWFFYTVLQSARIPPHFALFPEQIANALSLCIAFLYSFLLHRYWSFRSHGQASREFVLSVLLLAANSILSSLLLSFMMRSLGWNAFMAKLLLMCMIPIWNYFIFHYFIYKTAHAKLS